VKVQILKQLFYVAYLRCFLACGPRFNMDSSENYIYIYINIYYTLVDLRWKQLTTDAA
jgi:hypothetical protein